MKPPVGRVVHFLPLFEEQKCWKGDVVAVNEDGTVNLVVFSPEGMMRPETSVRFSDTSVPGTWHWPERVE